ncbi:coiled-coil domain-containing protein 42-like isoform X1 [Brachyhypopomus gauderio]|uniref:coiled-coil domain-containing protein 42-like isoform X1 n=1 Tax=Brachyhypopomus gauderio TaxID=698409 RepID=UPI004042E1A6
MSEYGKSYFEANLLDQVVRTTSTTRLSLPLRLLQKRRENVEVHDSMIQRRAHFESYLEELRVRREVLEEKKVQMKEHLHNTLKENELKRCQALKKARREREQTNQKQAELLAMQEEMKSLIKERDELANRVRRTAIYPEYLYKVVQASKQFQDVSEVMSRYETLCEMREVLVRTTEQNQDRVEQLRGQLARVITEGGDKVVQYNNHLAQLQRELDEVHANRMIWESRWAHIQNTAAKKTLLLGTIKMATLNLYQLVCKRANDTKEMPVAPEDTLKQLDKIQDVLLDLIYVWEEVSQTETAVSNRPGFLK